MPNDAELDAEWRMPDHACMMMRPPVGEAKNERRGRLGHRLSPRSAKHSPKELMSATEDVSFENPLETGSSEPRALAELDIEAALKAGTLTEESAPLRIEMPEYADKFICSAVRPRRGAARARRCRRRVVKAPRSCGDPSGPAQTKELLSPW
jgi:hypothetical protein